MKNIFKINGTLTIENTDEIVEKFLLFCEEQAIMFSGTIAGCYIDTKNKCKIRLDSLQLSSRLKNILLDHNIHYLDELQMHYIEDIQLFQNLGPTTFAELKQLMDQYNIYPISYLKETVDFFHWRSFERKELYEKNVRTLEKLYLISEVELAQLFSENKRLYIKLKNKKIQLEKNKKNE